MCGIAGAIGFHPSLHTDVIRRLSESMAHRGPDDVGLYSAAGSPSISLVHRRLAIQDLTQNGHQPMSTECGRYTVVFNGEIYNQQELRRSLAGSGVEFRSTSDTEVLLHMLCRYGEHAVQKLRGMYAFCFWDNLEKTAILARDPYGIKPLYIWTGEHGQLLFASEVRSLLQTGLIPRELEISGLTGFLLHGSIPEPFTLVKNVLSLAPGWMAIWQDWKMSKQPHWQPKFTASITSHYPTICDYTRIALEESAKAHLISDVPIGLFLSGGLDSSALLSLTKESSLTALSIRFEEEAFDESARAQRVADYYGVKQTFLTLSEKKAAELLPSFLDAVDQPSIDGFNTYCVSNLASEQGLKVVLSGLGGDELFGGYPSFQKIPQLLTLHRRLGILRSVVAGSLANSTEHRRQRLADFLSKPATPQTAHACLRGLFSSLEIGKVYEHWNINANPKDSSHDSYELSATSRRIVGTEEPEELLDQVAWLESSLYMGQQLLRDSDVYSMANGLELRIPFVDSKLFGLISSIKPSYRLSKNKKLLQDSLPELSKILPKAPKQGFTIPFRVWFDRPGSELKLGGSNYPLPHLPFGIDLNPWPRRWGLMVLKYWLKQHLELDI